MKSRVQQRGGKIEPPNALSHARRVQREADLISDQNAFFRDGRWIAQNIHLAIDALMSRLLELSQQIGVEVGMSFVAHVQGRRCVLRDNRNLVSMNIGWRQGYVNTVMEEAEIIAAKFNGPLYTRQEQMMTMFMPKELRRARFTPTLSLSREVCWIEAGKRHHPLSAEELAHRILSLFLDLLNRADKGQIDSMLWPSVDTLA